MAHRRFRCIAKKDIERAHIKSGDYFRGIEHNGADYVIFLSDGTHLEINGRKKFDELFEEISGTCPLDINRDGWNKANIEPDKEWPVLMCSWYDGPNFITGKYSLENKEYISDSGDIFGSDDIDYWMYIPQLPENE